MGKDLLEFLEKYNDWEYIQSLCKNMDKKEHELLLSVLNKLGSFRNINDEVVFIDSGLELAISHLNKLGVKTKYSCSGHEGVPYIALDGMYKINGLNNCKVTYILISNLTIIKPNIKYKENNLFVLYNFVISILGLTKDDFNISKIKDLDIEVMGNNRFNLYILSMLGISDKEINLTDNEKTIFNKYWK